MFFKKSIRGSGMINKKAITSFSILIITIFGLLFFAFSAPVSASGLEAAKTGLNETAKTGLGGGDIGKVPFAAEAVQEGGLALVLGKMIGIILSFLGVLFFALMIYGGFLWMTARGNDQQVTNAKELIIAAVIGLIIVLSAYAITAFVGSNLQ